MQFPAEQPLDAVPNPFSTRKVKNQTTVESRRTLRRWAIAAGCAVLALLLFALVHPRATPDLRMTMQAETAAVPHPAPMAMKAAPVQRASISPDAAQLSRSTASMMYDAAAPVKPVRTAMPAGSMIARTVSLIIQVKDVASSRSALDVILARYQGYAAELNINTPENAARTFGASLRIPEPALAAALEELRRLGRVQIESQSGEEVTQQHTDL